ncbi:membrane protein [Methanoculleus sediminis]|uniref:Membrane protein n=2 Tax=Methanoculleus sediminis TaxID=1550566 RepID=A0A0H1R2G8_9EURY|nr:membrane protein [Methanoculleus sediminis]
MRLPNPFRMNDWNNKTFFWVFQAIQIVFLGVVCLDLVGYYIPIAREALAFLYLTFIPGVLVLKALRLHDLGTIETVLYSAGLSLVVVMLTGLTANFVYPLLGYTRPFSFAILLLTLVAVVQVLLYLALTRDKGRTGESPGLAVPSSPAVPFLMLLPFLAIIGTYLRDNYHMVTLLFLLLVLIAVIGLAVGFDRLIPKSCYGLGIYTIALSLLYHTSLISEYVWGYDIHHELHLANGVLIPGLWDMTIPYNTNGMLSVVALVPIYSLICDLDPVWIFKIVYPLLFALVPLGLYRAVEKQTDARIGFLSIFFFFSFFTFYTEMISLARQQIAELFLALTVLAMIDKTMDRGKRAFLMIAFAFAMIVSHYGLSYIYLFSLVPAWLLLAVPERLYSWLPERLARGISLMRPDPLVPARTGGRAPVRTLVLPYILIFAALTYLWYSTVAEGTALATVTGIGDKIWNTLFTDSFNPTTAQGMHILTSQSTTLLHGLAKVVHIATQGLIAVGLLATLARRERWRIEPEYLAVSLVFLLINVAGIVVPFFASSLNTSRLYHITLIFLAPFAIIGGIALYERLTGWIHAIRAAPFMGTAYQALAAFFVVFFLFNSGLLYQVMDDNPTSMALDTAGDKPVFNGREVQGAVWLFSEGNERPIYVDGTRWWLLLGFNPGSQRYVPANASLLEPNSYLYFGTYNLMRESIRIETQAHAVTTATYTDAERFIRDHHRIYDNAGSAVYYR